MDVKELRVDNIVYGPNKQAVCKVKYIDGEEKTISTDLFSERDVNELSPIPLTEEWLLKLGYIENDAFIGEKPTIFTHGIHKIWKPFNQFLDNNYRFEIQYVHQLQNLYFDLAGE